MNKYLNYYLIIISLVFFFVFLLSGNWFFKNKKTNEIYGKAIIIDGDTIDINKKRIRLYGIDAFEKKQECFRKDGTKYKCGERAISALAEIISSQSVRCIKEEKKDKYKRILATCYIGKLDINKNMVLYGYAFAYIKYSKKYKDVENDAKKVGAGAWSGKFNYPWEWKKLK